MSELEKQINEALSKGVNLSEKEYKEKVIEADEITATHGVKGEAPVKESVRHKRIQSNFYGISLNFLANLLGELATQTQLLNQQNAMLFALCKENNVDVDKLFRNNE